MLNITVGSTLIELYINGKLQGTTSGETHTYDISYDVTTLALHGRSDDVIAGILVSDANGEVLSGDHWRCTAAYNSTDW